MTRSAIPYVLVCTVISLALPSFGEPQAQNPLEMTFAHMDPAAATFKGLTAEIRQVSRTEVVNVEDVQEGKITVKRFKPGDTRILIKFSKPEEKFYAIGGGKFRSFVPKSQEAQEADLGNSKDIVNQFMLLAFGSNSNDLKAAYVIKFGGAERVSGENANRLEMVP